MSEEAEVVLAIDPGRRKCGVAVVKRAVSGSIEALHQAVVSTDGLTEAAGELSNRFAPNLIIIGSGTASADVRRLVQRLNIAPIQMVNEKFTTLLARKRYFAHNPPRGIRRLIPISLQTPGRPYDDYVALILAENYFSSR